MIASEADRTVGVFRGPRVLRGHGLHGDDGQVLCDDFVRHHYRVHGRALPHRDQVMRLGP